MNFKKGDRVRIRQDIDEFVYGTNPEIEGWREHGSVLTIISMEDCSNSMYHRRAHGVASKEGHCFDFVQEELEKAGHPHAELMAQYADDALSSVDPWELWEVGSDDSAWKPLFTHPRWLTDNGYRRKPKTHFVNGFEVPAPDPKGTFVADPFSIHWHTDVYRHPQEGLTVARGRNLTFSCREAAVANAKAMCGIDPTEKEK